MKITADVFCPIGGLVKTTQTISVHGKLNLITRHCNLAMFPLFEACISMRDSIYMLVGSTAHRKVTFESMQCFKNIQSREKKIQSVKQKANNISNEVNIEKRQGVLPVTLQPLNSDVSCVFFLILTMCLGSYSFPYNVSLCLQGVF